MQKYSCSVATAKHLATTYGARAHTICEMASHASLPTWPKFGSPFLAPGFPYIEAEVRYACREYACTVEDILSRRTRLAFLNKEAAVAAVPRVAEIMAEELGWSEEVRLSQEEECYGYLATYGGATPTEECATGDVSVLRTSNFRDLKDVFKALDADGSGFLEEDEIGRAALELGFPFESGKELRDVFERMNVSGDGKVTLEEFSNWWTSESDKDADVRGRMSEEIGAGGESVQKIKDLGTGVMLG